MGNLRAKCFPRFERQCKRKQRRAKSSSNNNNNRPNMCNKQPPPPPTPPTTYRGTISFIPCKEHNLFAEQREKPTTSKGSDLPSRHVASHERESSRARESAHEHEAFTRQVLLLLLLLVRVLVLALSRRAHSLSRVVRALSTRRSRRKRRCTARAAIKAAVTGDDSNILNAIVVKYTHHEHCNCQSSYISLTSHTYIHTPWPPNTSYRKPTNTAR